MKTGFDFIQRMQQDAEFRRKVNACLQSEERLAFLKKKETILPRLYKLSIS
jgi:hypothetical protein